MAGRLAILAGGGALPPALAAAHPGALRIVFAEVAHRLEGPAEEHRFERLGALFDALRAQGVDRVVLAGSMARPPLDPGLFDPVMHEIAPRLLAAMQGGDDALLRFVIGLFEAHGFAVVGAHDLLPGLTAPPGPLAGPGWDDRAQADAARAGAILAALSPLDVGQGAVVACGQCLGIETVQGTDALLDFVAATPAQRRPPGGVLLKAPKQGQDLRVDMPAIGPETLRRAARARLSGVVIAAHGVMILDRAATLEEATRTGLFLHAAEGLC